MATCARAGLDRGRDNHRTSTDKGKSLLQPSMSAWCCAAMAQAIKPIEKEVETIRKSVRLVEENPRRDACVCVSRVDHHADD